MAKSLPDTHSERIYMTKEYEDKPGYANLFYTAKEDKEYPNSPDYDGKLTLKMDYKAGEKIKLDVWTKTTQYGKPMLSLKENTWAKEKALERAQNSPERPPEPTYPQEVTPAYRQAPKTGYRKRDDDHIPF